MLAFSLKVARSLAKALPILLLPHSLQPCPFKWLKAICLNKPYTNRLEAANLRASVGTTGDSYDNALAETVNGLYKTEVIEYLKADWQGLADVQLATLNWVDWFNKKRVHSALGYVSPFEFEAMYYDKINPLGQVA